MNEELKVIISAEIADLKKNVQNAQKEVKDLSTKGESNFKKFSEAAKKAGNTIKEGLKVAVTAVAAAGAALVALAESTKEYRTEQAKLVTAFESAGSSAEQAKTTYNDLYRVLGDSGQATEAANHLALLTTNEKDLATWTNICQGVYATFGDSLPIEGLTEAANETAKVGTVTGGLADALNWAGVSEDAFNEKLAACNTEAEREALIRDTLNGIYADAAKNYEENASSLLSANEAQAALTDGLAKLGEVAEPIVTIFKSGLATVLQEIAPHLATVSQGLQDVINGVEGGSDKMASGISGIMTTAVNTITEMLPTLLTVGVQIITSLINGIVSALPTVIQTLVGAIPTIIDAIVNAFTAIVEALPTIIQAIVNALPTIIPALVNGITTMVVTICENFSSIIMPLIDALPDIIISVVDAIVSNLPALIDGIITLVIGIVEAIPRIIQGIVDAIPTIISLLIESLLSNLPKIIAGLIKVVWGVIKALPQIFGSLIEGIVNIFAGIWDGLGKVFGKVGSWFKDKFSGAAKGIKEAFGSIGSFFSGIWDKIKSVFSKVGTTIGNAITNTVKKAVNGVLSTATKIINGFIKAINFAIGIINKIPGVNIGKLKELDVPKMAKGGIVDAATVAVIGEQGKEAVVPLENNLEWLDKLADRITAKQGTKPVVLKVGEKVFGEICVDSINGITTQRGNLPLILV